MFHESELLPLLGAANSVAADTNRAAGVWLASATNGKRTGALLRAQISSTEVDESRLRELPYLAALGFSLDAGLLNFEASGLHDAIKTVSQRPAFTAESTGLADNAIFLLGVVLLARRLALAGPLQSLRDAFPVQRESPRTHVEALLLALAAKELGLGAPEHRGTQSGPLDWAAVVVLNRATPDQLEAVFSGADVSACHRKLCALERPFDGPYSRLDAILVALALEDDVVHPEESGATVYPPVVVDPSRLEIRPVRDRNDLPEVAFLISTAVEIERNAVLEAMKPLAEEKRILKMPWREATYYVGVLGLYRCVLVMGEAGTDKQRGSALEAHAALERWNPNAVISAGCPLPPRSQGEGWRP